MKNTCQRDHQPMPGSSTASSINRQTLFDAPAGSPAERSLPAARCQRHFLPVEDTKKYTHTGDSTFWHTFGYVWALWGLFRGRLCVGGYDPSHTHTPQKTRYIIPVEDTKNTERSGEYRHVHSHKTSHKTRAAAGPDRSVKAQNLRSYYLSQQKSYRQL